LCTCGGKVFSGVHLEASVGRVAVCAEAIAIGAAASAGETAIDEIVAVTESGDVVPPCGICRELLRDYAPQARVILQVDGELQGVPVSELLPFPYRGDDYPHTRSV
jgi:cytidine deaminase